MSDLEVLFCTVPFSRKMFIIGFLWLFVLFLLVVGSLFILKVEVARSYQATVIDEGMIEVVCLRDDVDLFLKSTFFVVEKEQFGYQIREVMDFVEGNSLYKRLLLDVELSDRYRVKGAFFSFSLKEDKVSLGVFWWNRLKEGIYGTSE